MIILLEQASGLQWTSHPIWPLNWGSLLEGEDRLYIVFVSPPIRGVSSCIIISLAKTIDSSYRNVEYWAPQHQTVLANYGSLYMPNSDPGFLEFTWAVEGSLRIWGHCSPILVTPHTQQERTINVWAMVLIRAKNRFLVLTEVGGGPLSISL